MWCSWSIASWKRSSFSFQACASIMGASVPGALESAPIPLWAAPGVRQRPLGGPVTPPPDRPAPGREPSLALLALRPELLELLVRLRELRLVAQVHRDGVAHAAR